MNILQPLHVLVFREEDWWIAQCLEIDLAAQAKNLDDVVYEFGRTLAGTCMVRMENGLPGIEELPPAPGPYWKAYEQAILEVGTKLPPRFQPTAGPPPAYMIPKIAMRMRERLV
jgi:hypothetical protein